MGLLLLLLHLALCCCCCYGCYCWCWSCYCSSPWSVIATSACSIAAAGSTSAVNALADLLLQLIELLLLLLLLLGLRQDLSLSTPGDILCLSTLARTFAGTYWPSSFRPLPTIDGHNRRWIDGSIPIVSIDTIDQYFWSHFHRCYWSIG